MSANEYSGREIHIIEVFSIAFLNDYVGSNHFAKVVHNHIVNNNIVTEYTIGANS